MTDPFRTKYRELTEREVALIGELKDNANTLYEVLSDIDQSRMVSLAKTKLEECVMWATKAITEKEK